MSIILVVIVFSILTGLFIPLNRIAKRKGTVPRLWESALIFAWAVIWLSVSYIRKFLQTIFADIQTERNVLLFIGFVLSLLAYGLIWWLIKRKPDIKGCERKVGEIGKKE